MNPDRRRTPIAWLVLLAALLVLRLPSLVQPAGGDQGLYVYEAQRVLAGDVPYRDVWDQKPAGIAFLFAALWRIWPHESVVAAADLAAAAGVAWLLIVVGRRQSRHVGYGAASLFLMFGDPYLQRLSGVYVRGQCEPFIALAVTAAIAVVAAESRQRWRLVLAGVLLAAAFWLKYNAAAYALPLALAVWVWTPSADRGPRRLARDLMWIGAGFAGVAAAFLTYFAATGSLNDLWLATITYNLQYSDETYAGAANVLTYPIRMVIDRGSVDMLWFVGGLGAVLMLWQVRTHRSTVVWLGWLVAAVLSIAINGQRNLPNYFVQANPALAIAAAAGLATLRLRAPWLRYATAAALAAGFWRVGADVPVAGLRWGGLPGLVENVRFDVSYLRGHMDRSRYLGRFKGAKHDALEVDDLARYVRETTAPADPIFVFGFSGGSVCFKSARMSASRFFWSRPVLIEFAADQPGYGSRGMLAELERHPPTVLALQREQWASETFFMKQAGLRAWLQEGYTLDHETPMFSVWRRRP